MKLELSCNPLDILIVLCIPYDDDIKRVRDAYNNVGYVALNMTQLGWKPGEHIRRYIANRHHRHPIYDDVDYDYVNAGLANLMCVSMPLGTDINRWMKRAEVKNTMRNLGDTDYADYINTLDIDQLLRTKMETENRWRTETAERVNKYAAATGKSVKTGNKRTYHMSDKPRKQRCDKGMKRAHYNKKALTS